MLYKNFHIRIMESPVKNNQLFPSRISLFIFILYIGLFVNQGLIVTASQQKDNSYNYNVATVVLLTEVVKLVVSVALYLKSESFGTFCHALKTNWRLLVLYMVPAFLYCLYNNLAFYNLGLFDPTTYFLVLNLRVVVTGMLFQVLFKKQLTVRQWLSLLILTIGCIVKQFSGIQKGYPDKAFNENEKSFNLYHIFSLKSSLIFLQIFCSCFAGVFNEKLLKDIGVAVPILLQNVFMYVDSIFWNFAFLVVAGQSSDAFSVESLHKVLQTRVIIIIINSSAMGIVTSFFLRNLNAILKNFASALELVFTAILSWMIFGIAIDAWTMVSISIVIYATFLYSQNPVVNRGKLDELECQDKHDIENPIVAPKLIS